MVWYLKAVKYSALAGSFFLGPIGIIAVGVASAFVGAADELIERNERLKQCKCESNEECDACKGKDNIGRDLAIDLLITGLAGGCGIAAKAAT